MSEDVKSPLAKDSYLRDYYGFGVNASWPLT